MNKDIHDIIIGVISGVICAAIIYIIKHRKTLFPVRNQRQPLTLRQAFEEMKTEYDEVTSSPNIFFEDQINKRNQMLNSRW